MLTNRKSPFALMAWVLPLVMVISWASGAAGMVCQAQGALVRSGCCCGPVNSDAQSAGAERGQQSSLQDAECCETQVAEAPVVVPADLSLSPQISPAVQVLCLQLDGQLAPASPPGGWAALLVPRAQGKPIVLLKRAFLI
jgi:hypothetical protein